MIVTYCDVPRDTIYIGCLSEMHVFLTAQPLHWVYDLQKLRGFLDENPNPEFRPKPENPFYRRQTGKQSCYGDQAFVLLESLSECGGRLFLSYPNQMSFKEKPTVNHFEAKKNVFLLCSATAFIATLVPCM